MRLVAVACVLAACGPAPRGNSGDDDGRGLVDASVELDGNSSGDAGGGGQDGGGGGQDGGGGGGQDGGAPGVITGGPCLSGQPGATAYRIRWAQAGSGVQVVYEVNGLPDHSRDHAGAFGYQIGFTPSFVDPFLGAGGLQLDGSDFVDLELTTAGVAQIASAKLAIFGRSFNTTTSGSFTWQTFEGTGAAPTNLVSNVAPYAWYAADMTTEISAGDSGVLLRIKAGPSSGVLVVNRIELCVEAS